MCQDWYGRTSFYLLIARLSPCYCRERRTPLAKLVSSRLDLLAAVIVSIASLVQLWQIEAWDQTRIQAFLDFHRLPFVLPRYRLEFSNYDDRIQSCIHSAGDVILSKTGRHEQSHLHIRNRSEVCHHRCFGYLFHVLLVSSQFHRSILRSRGHFLSHHHNLF